MGRKGTATIIELTTIGLDDVPAMTKHKALSELERFCNLNHFTDTERQDAFSLFRRAAATPGEPVIVPTEVSANHTVGVHSCMQAITDNTLAHGLAVRGFDAAPGTHFEHDMREDACRLTNTCTNAVT